MSLTYDEQLQYYANLLVIQYRSKAKAQATIQSLARQALCDNLALQVQDAFTLETAVGVQLDVLGKYAGVQRDVLTFTGGAALSDSDFLKLIYMALVVNHCQGSLQDIDALLIGFFGNDTIVFDHANMTIGYFFNARIGSLPLLEAFVKLDLLPRPMGVTISSLIYAVGLTNVFGMGSYYSPPFEVSGFSSYYTGNVHTTGNTDGTAIVTGIPDTSVLTAGDPIGGEQIDVSTTILSIDSPTQITLSKITLGTKVGANLYEQAPAPWLSYINVVSF